MLKDFSDRIDDRTGTDRNFLKLSIPISRTDKSVRCSKHYNFTCFSCFNVFPVGSLGNGFHNRRTETAGYVVIFNGYYRLSLQNEIYEKSFYLVALEREVRKYISTYDLFSNKIESARIAKSETLPDMRIISRAIEPKEKIAPFRTRSVLISGFTAFFVMLILAFFVEYLERAGILSEILKL